MSEGIYRVEARIREIEGLLGETSEPNRDFGRELQRATAAEPLLREPPSGGPLLPEGRASCGAGLPPALTEISGAEGLLGSASLGAHHGRSHISDTLPPLPGLGMYRAHRPDTVIAPYQPMLIRPAAPAAVVPAGERPDATMLLGPAETPTIRRPERGKPPELDQKLDTLR